jgi:hypothetical protein
MSELFETPQERDFHCPECSGRIVIPSNLPATTGPCPHCQATITSPEPLIVDALPPQEQPDPEPVVVTSPPPVEKSSPPVEVSPTVEESSPPVEESSPEEPEEISPATPEKSVKRKSSASLLLLLVLLLVALGGGAYFLMGYFKDKDTETAGFNQPNKAVVNPTLQKYLAASTLEEKLNYVYNADELRPKIEAFYKERAISEAGTPANAFSMIKLPAKDSKKGFILFFYDKSASKALDSTPQNPANTPTSAGKRIKILAFMKETEKGVKLDWEIFAQTRYRTFNDFINTPEIGKSEVFRLTVTTKKPEESAVGNPTITYELADPAYSYDKTKITPDPNSQAGQALASLIAESAKDTEPVQQTATIELTWTGDKSSPKLEIKRFICWQFLNLGGKEIAETGPSN